METHGLGYDSVLGEKSYLSVFFLLFSICTGIQPAGLVSSFD